VSEEMLWDESLTSGDFLKTLLATALTNDERVCCFMKCENMCFLFILQNTAIRLKIRLAIWLFF